MPKVSADHVTSRTLTGGEALVHSLIAHGVDTLFGLPGVQNDYFYNALYDARDRIRVIHTRHEQATAYMALGYALATGRPGVYNVVPGPGFLNSTAALSTAPIAAAATNAGELHARPGRPWHDGADAAAWKMREPLQHARGAERGRLGPRVP